MGNLVQVASVRATSESVVSESAHEEQEVGPASKNTSQRRSYDNDVSNNNAVDVGEHRFASAAADATTP